MSDEVLVERDGGVVILTLNRPDRLNAMSPGMRLSLVEAFRDITEDRSVRAVLLTGAGRGFCSGADLDLDNILPRRPIIERSVMTGVNVLVRLMRELPVPVIAAVNGPAAGVGFSLALACDLIVAANSAKFGLAFVKIGAVMDGGISSLLTHRIGASRTAALAMLGGNLDAVTARDWGLVHEVVEDDKLHDAGRALAGKLAKGPTLALGLIKHEIAAAQSASFDESLRLEAACQGQAFNSRDFEEGVRAFSEKRRPVFTGE